MGPKPNLKKPPEMDSEVWEKPLADQWEKSGARLPPNPDWQTLCRFTENLVFATLEQLQISRRQGI